MQMHPADWLRVVRREYIEDYIPAGGAAVKFIVPADDAGREALVAGLRGDASAAGCVFAFVDARHTRLHLIDRVFSEVAAQVGWDALTDAFLRRLFGARGYRLPDAAEGLRLETLAAHNEVARVDLPEFDREVTNLLRQGLYHNYSLSYEFRLAMMRLCEARLQPESASADLADLVKMWLRGELRTLSPLKPALIFQKVARHNARHLFASLAQWTHLAGAGGLVLCLDIGRYTEAARPVEPDGTFYYSTAAAIDTYEVLRQFIDATDELGHCFIAVVAARSFLEDERRGLNRYDALKLRIWDEVHDRRRANPLASLVRIAPAPAQAAVAAETPP